jgi:hypothetical protein
MADHPTPRKIIGVSMAPDLAVKVKEEAAREGVSIRKLFERMWDAYQKNKKAQNAG